MCGIVGQISFKADFMADCSGALSSLRSRGPDNMGLQNFVMGESTISLGHTRLSIIDLSSQASQPMSTLDGRYSIVFNGEIYNYKELRSILINSGRKFRTDSDTEVLLEAYCQYGPNFVSKLDGMFSLAIVDKDNQTIFLARDPFGEKPLFIYIDDEQFSFSSEINALKQLPKIARNLTINQTSVHQFFMFGFIPNPKCIFKEVVKFKPSTYAIFDLKKKSITPFIKYWDPLKYSNINLSLSEPSLIERMDALITSSVSSRMNADVPICNFLSGGVDSSLVLAVARKLHFNIESFSISFPGYGGDESKFAQIVANHVNSKLHILEMTSNEMSASALKFLDYVDEPIADAAAIPLYFLSQEVSKNFKVALGGDGGDELFGGYVKYKAQAIIEKYHSLLFMASALKKVKALPDSYKRLFEGASINFPQRQFIFGSGGFLPSEIGNLFSTDNVDTADLYLEFESVHASLNQLDSSSKSMWLDCKFQLPDWYLVKSDRATMANGLELRSPLLNKEIAEMVFSIPSNLKIKDGISKYLLKKLASRYLPKDIIYRPKMGFGVDLNSWIKSDKFKELVFLKNDLIGIDYRWVEKNYETLPPMKLMRVAFMNHYLEKISRK